MRDDILTYAWFHKLACNCCDACLQKLFYGYVSFLQGGHCTQNSPSFNFFLNFVLAQELWQPDASSWIVKDGGGGSQKKQLHPSPSNGLAWSQHWLLCEEAIAFSSIRSTPFTGMEWLHLKSKLVAMQKKAIVHCQQGMSWSMNIFLFQTSGDRHSMQLTVLITPNCDRPGLTQFRLMES